MCPHALIVHEDDVEREEHSDRWSKNLVGTDDIVTTSGFNLGVASYHAEEFGEVQTHNDQEAVYVVSGAGEIRLGESVIPVRPGVAISVPPGMPHATRRTGPDPVKVVYSHGAI